MDSNVQYNASPPSYGQPQQQQQQVVVVGAAQPTVVVQQTQSFAGHIAFACVVAWCCNCLFGLVAFILASQYSLSTIILNINIEKFCTQKS